MLENDIIVKKIDNIQTDTLYPGKPFIPINPRELSTVAYMTEGQLKYTVGESSHVVRKGEIIFVHGGNIDISEAFECSQVSYILADFSPLDDNFEFPTRISVSSAVGARISELFSEMYSIWRSGAISRKTKCMARLYLILSILADEIFEKSRDSYRFRKLSPSIEYINKYCLDPGFNRARLAELSNMSAVNLNRLFKEFFGVTVGEYINNRRMDEAKTLLMNSSNTISEIAIKCGFADIYSFSHSFHRNTGLSPTEWRKK